MATDEALVYEFGPYRLEEVRGRITLRRRGTEVEKLAQTELGVLLMLVRNRVRDRDQVVTKQELYKALRSEHQQVLMNCIYHLREALGRNPPYILAVPG